MPKILLVEDEALSNDTLARRLARRGYRLVTAMDGGPAVALAATQQIRARPHLSRMPIICLRAHPLRGDRERALAASGDDYDTQPVDFERLLRKIETVLPQDHP